MSVTALTLARRLEVLIVIIRVLTLAFSQAAWQPLGSGAALMRVERRISLNQYSLLLILLVFINSHSCYICLFSMGQPRPRLKLSFVILTFLSLWFFFVTTGLLLYMIFEIRLIPIFCILVGWGYQPERVRARKAIFIYTVWGSLPLLTVILYQSKSGVLRLEALTYRRTSATLISLIPLAAFLVKIPLFLVHIWLPKAHVEAPAPGSMFLAAILLKLGGYGLMLFSSLSSSLLGRGILISIGLWGRVRIAIRCAQSIDVKRLIALSSVGHMRLAVAVVLRGHYASIRAGFLVLLTHGFSSSLAFFVSYVLYKSFGSRSLVLIKSSTRADGVLTVVWYSATLALVGCPPSANLWVEIIVYLSVLANSRLAFKRLIIAALLRGVYGFILLGRVGTGIDEVVKTPAFINQLDMGHAIFRGFLSVIAVIYLPGVLC